jgi:SAM-dependent methyltransferase
VLDLGEQPPANSYLRSINDEEYYFPLKLNYCLSCTHLQLSHAIDPDILFKNYLYVSGTTQTLKKYFDEFVCIVENHCENQKPLKILDIACNDGSQLNAFKNAGHKTYGIDPATNLYSISSQNHNIVCDYLTENSIGSFNEKFDVIIAQNVFAHNSYPKEFLEICKRYLSDNGTIFIQTSQSDMVLRGQFDTIYHEHISFFNLKSMTTLVDHVGLYLNKVIKTPIHGNSYVFMISKIKRINKLDYEEKSMDIDMINKFVNGAQDTISDLKNQIQKYLNKNPDSLVVGYGAAAKGNTVLNYGKIKLDYIVDDNQLKQGLYTPGMHIPIVSLDTINAMNKNIIWIPLSWNFFDEIKNKIIQYRNNPEDKFILMNFVS